VFTRALHWSISWATSIQFIPSHPISLISILILSTHLPYGLPSGPLSFWLSHQYSISILRLPHSLCRPISVLIMSWIEKPYCVMECFHCVLLLVFVLVWYLLDIFAVLSCLLVGNPYACFFDRFNFSLYVAWSNGTFSRKVGGVFLNDLVIGLLYVYLSTDFPMKGLFR
jgi:hypothetical protein